MTDNPILLSWVSNYGYCPRRFYLASIEGQEPGANVYMTEGSIQHQRVDQYKTEKRGNNIKVTRLHVYSDKHDIYGICDNVEFTVSEDGVYIPFLKEKCQICPVEYKHGKIRNESEYDMQLMCQTLCLEEMYQTKIPAGYIYYMDAHHRHEVIFDDTLRSKTFQALSEMHEILKDPKMIAAKYMKRCPKCSYYEICSPKQKMVTDYVKWLWDNI